MNLTELKNKVVEMGQAKITAKENYIRQTEILGKQVLEGTLWSRERDNRLNELKHTINQTFSTTSMQLNELLNQFREKELERVEESYQAVTADDVAELDLLGSMSTTQEELERYLEKFAKKPLAIRKIYEIAQKQEPIILLPPAIDKKKLLNDLIDKMKRDVNFFENLYLDENKVNLVVEQMTVEGTDENLTRLIEEYNNA